MTRLISTLLLSACFCCFACREDTNDYTLGIDVQSVFAQDNVQIILDQTELIDKPLETNPLLGFCSPDGLMRYSIPEGEHNIQVVINHSITKTENFSLNDDLYIVINFDPQSEEISLAYSDEPILYD